jgi:hypothetical protein
MMSPSTTWSAIVTGIRAVTETWTLAAMPSGFYDVWRVISISISIGERLLLGHQWSHQEEQQELWVLFRDLIESVKKGYEMTCANAVSVARENRRESESDGADGMRAEGHT